MSESLVPRAPRKLNGASLIGNYRHPHAPFAFPCNGHLVRVHAHTFSLFFVACITTLIKQAASAVSIQMTFENRLSKVVQVVGKCSGFPFVNERLKCPTPQFEFPPTGQLKSN